MRKQGLQKTSCFLEKFRGRLSRQISVNQGRWARVRVDVAEAQGRAGKGKDASFFKIGKYNEANGTIGNDNIELAKGRKFAGEGGLVGNKMVVEGGQGKEGLEKGWSVEELDEERRKGGERRDSGGAEKGYFGVAGLAGLGWRESALRPVP